MEENQTAAALSSSASSECQQAKALFKQLLAACASRSPKKMLIPFSYDIDFKKTPFRDSIKGKPNLQKYFTHMVKDFDTLEFKLHGMFRDMTSADVRYNFLWSGTYIETKRREKIELIASTYIILKDGKISCLVNMMDRNSLMHSTYLVVK